MIVLPDTSIWVQYLRHGRTRPVGLALDELLDDRAVVVCGPVLAEVLAGTPADGRPELWSLLSVLPWARLNETEWRLVGDVAAGLREQGQTVAMTDITIAVAAAAIGASLWSRDSDFARIERVLPTLSRYTPRKVD